jgi:hypothetical protein
MLEKIGNIESDFFSPQKRNSALAQDIVIKYR